MNNNANAGLLSLTEEEIFKKALYFINKYKESRSKEDFDWFLYYCIFSSNKGNVQADLLLGNVYFNDDGYEELEEVENYTEALKYYQKAAKKGNAYALYSLGWMYQHGLGVDVDYEKTLEYYKQAAEKGDADALYNLGWMYQHGLGVDVDYEAALKYYKQAAEKGNAHALNNLGWMYQHGLGVDVDYEKALKYYKQAAEKGNAYALNNLGYTYQDGLGVDVDYEKALEYYKQAAEKGDADALYNLGYMYYYGKGVKEDYKKALEYFEQAAEKENNSALNNLGYMYQYGLGVDVDYEKALEYYKQAAEKGHARAMAIILEFKFFNGEKIDFSELFEKRVCEYEYDSYFEKIKTLVNSGRKVISVERLNDLSNNNMISNDNNENFRMLIESMLDNLGNQSDNDVICIKECSCLLENLCRNFYTVSDMKKIIKTCNKLLSSIDLNQSEEDIFMQIYIKLGKLISYDYSATREGKEEKLKKSTSRNLMVLLNKKGVCAGYAEVLKNILDIVGIESKYIESENDKKGIGHAYNQVKINGIWYNCDLTWDSDRIKLGGPLKYCLKSENSFGKLSNKNRMYHKPENETTAEKTPENFKEITSLFYKNYIKLFKNKIKNKLVEQIVTSPIIDEGGKRK